MKVLFVSHVANFQKFNNPYIKWLQSKNCEVHYASQDDEAMEAADCFHKIEFCRNPFDLSNIKALFQLIKLLKRERYDLIHCHTPVGGILSRAAAIFTPKTKVIYTAHGFHFFKGAPLKYNLLFKTAERIMAHHTDALVTINKEDYEAAKKFRLRKGGKVYYLNGVGVDTKAVRKVAEESGGLREKLGLSEDSFVVLTVAELIVRKNYETALEAFAKADIPGSRYLICGDGTEKENLKEKCKTLGILDKVIFLGYRRDIYNIIAISDAFLFTSHQEGLPIALIEAMAGGLPCVVSDIRGNNELIVADNGFILKDNDIDGFAEALRTLFNNSSMRADMGRKCQAAAEQYDIEITVEKMGEIYKSILNL